MGIVRRPKGSAARISTTVTLDPGSRRNPVSAKFLDEFQNAGYKMSMRWPSLPIFLRGNGGIRALGLSLERTAIVDIDIKGESDTGRFETSL